MSLPDTVFIFVLALIIFGPKKLPEIGRQLGKLVGEFRRASNEFKFQIEEELRQVELTDRTVAAPSKELEASNSTSSSSTSSDEADASGSPDLAYPEEILPVGQHPNIDNLDPYELNALNRESDEPEVAVAHKEEAAAEAVPATPTISPAIGTEPRTTHPYAASVADAATPAEAVSSDLGESSEAFPGPADTNALSTTKSTPPPTHEPDGPYATPSVADITHG